MNNYSISVSTTETKQDIQPCKDLRIVVGSTDVLMKLRKTPSASVSNAEEGDFYTLVATKTYLFHARKGAYWAIIHKTASSTSTLTVQAGNDQIRLEV